jgi:hypothetical protein
MVAPSSGSLSAPSTSSKVGSKISTENLILVCWTIWSRQNSISFFFFTFVLFPRLYGNCAIILKAEPAMEQREKQRQFHDAIILKAERAMEQLKKREARVAPKVRETMLTLEKKIKL